MVQTNIASSSVYAVCYYSGDVNQEDLNNIIMKSFERDGDKLSVLLEQDLIQAMQACSSLFAESRFAQWRM